MNQVLLHARYIEKELDSFLIEFNWDKPIVFSEILHAAGNMPLPSLYQKRTGRGRQRKIPDSIQQTTKVRWLHPQQPCILHHKLLKH
jgi:hypothetical protein